MDGDEGNWQNMSIGLSKNVILVESRLEADRAILQIPLKTLSLIQRDICLPSLGTLALGVR